MGRLTEKEYRQQAERLKRIREVSADYLAALKRLRPSSIVSSRLIPLPALHPPRHQLSVGLFRLCHRLNVLDTNLSVQVLCVFHGDFAFSGSPGIRAG